MPEGSAKLLTVLKDVFARRESVGLAGQIVPTAHQAGTVHVNERVGHTQVFGDELFEELPGATVQIDPDGDRERGYRRNTIHAPAASIRRPQPELHVGRFARSHIDFNGCRGELKTPHRLEP